MSLRPFFEVNFVAEEFTLKKVINFDTSFDYYRKVVFEEIRMREIVLVLNDVVYHVLQSLDLIIFNRNI